MATNPRETTMSRRAALIRQMPLKHRQADAERIAAEMMMDLLSQSRELDTVIAAFGGSDARSVSTRLDLRALGRTLAPHLVAAVVEAGRGSPEGQHFQG